MEKINCARNRIGQRYGRLTVVERAGTQRGNARWWCVCDCGKRKNVSGSCLQQGRVQSCGCLRKEIATEKARQNSENNILPDGVAASNLLYAVYRNGAETRKREFSLTREQFLELTSKNCYYCGDSPKSTYKSSTSKTGLYIYNGVDRVDNNIGYVLENCVPCCKVCNLMKKAQTEDEFYQSCLKVVNFMNHKKSAEMSDSIVINNN